MGFLDSAQDMLDRGVTVAKGAVSTVAGEQLSFVRGMSRMCQAGCAAGYHERNGGNASYRLTQADVDALVEAVGDGHAIWFVTARVPEGWDEETNALLRKAADDHSNVHVIDWYEASEGHDEYLDEDGTHLTSKGAEAYAELISEAL